MSYFKFKYIASSPETGGVSFTADSREEAMQHFDEYMEENYPELYDVEITDIEEIND